MKIGVWLSQSFKPHEGGGFSYYGVLMDAIDKYNFTNVEVAFISIDGFVNGLSKEIICIPKTRFLLFKLGKKITQLLPQKITIKLDILLEKLITPILVKKGIQVIFYPIQNYAILTDFPFISNNWDIGHCSTYAFPELVNNGEFFKRNCWYAEIIHKALLVFCESESGKKELIRYTGIAEEKVKVTPTFAGRSIKISVSEKDQITLLNKFGIKKHEYFFYPAQMWAHKNHYGLLQAFNHLAAKYPHIKIIFTGSDKGNMEYIKKIIQNLNLQNSVIIGGFVTNEEIVSLYRNAIALVMPTFFGPTNMPLLEAIELDCPVLCTDLEGHREILKDAALYFQANEHTKIAECMEIILNKEDRETILLKANDVKKVNIFNVDYTIKEIQRHFTDLNNIRNCWE